MLSRKAKQLLTVIIKILVVGGAFYFIYNRLTGEESPDWEQFTIVLTQKKPLGLLLGILILTFLNRFVEILKWQNLAATVRQTSLAKATEEVLAAVTVALFSPNGIGEYAAKALYYSKAQTKTIIFLNLVCNGIQLLFAVAGGITGLVILNSIYPVFTATTMLLALGVIIALAITIFMSRNITVKGYSLGRLGEKINSLPKSVHRKNILLALLRYTVLMHQYYLLYLAFDVNLSYPLLMAAIAGTYLLGSSLPSFQFLDFAVKGSVAVYFFGLLGINEWIVALTATLIWLLNTVLPVTIGSYYVFRFKAGTNSH
ncbi:hypothetical protein [Flavobacterium coralii]|uniref:hypothetical protein n=1 Tax=Flavobacterium coralii TaxID=2838017 RepID=UPI000C6987D7|nr:hypothetical protein [Flavobacterium sp.]|tara:strand:- start:53276 stop:54217 length:942 start_codon:yes stop_codon:yes gene_type:complete